MLTWLLVNIEWDNKKQNILDLSDNIKDIPEFEDYNLEMSDNWFDDWVLNRIWENYLKTPDKNWQVDVRKNISTAIEMAKNEICIEAKNFNRDSQTYKTAIVNIESWNLKKQLEWINSLYYLAYSTEWKLWAKDSLKNHKNKRKKELINDANALDEKIQQALKNNNQDEFENLDKMKDSIIDEVKELVKWDIFEAWELDKIDNSISEKREQN
jgi:DNA anti-recombination protein RmuC